MIIVDGINHKLMNSWYRMHFKGIKSYGWRRITEKSRRDLFWCHLPWQKPFSEYESTWYLDWWSRTATIPFRISSETFIESFPLFGALEFYLFLHSFLIKSLRAFKNFLRDKKSVNVKIRKRKLHIQYPVGTLNAHFINYLFLEWNNIRWRAQRYNLGDGKKRLAVPEKGRFQHAKIYKKRVMKENYQINIYVTRRQGEKKMRAQKTKNMKNKTDKNNASFIKLLVRNASSSARQRRPLKFMGW